MELWNIEQNVRNFTENIVQLHLIERKYPWMHSNFTGWAIKGENNNNTVLLWVYGRARTDHSLTVRPCVTRLYCSPRLPRKLSYRPQRSAQTWYLWPHWRSENWNKWFGHTLCFNFSIYATNYFQGIATLYRLILKTLNDVSVELCHSLIDLYMVKDFFQICHHWRQAYLYIVDSDVCHTPGDTQS